MRAERPPLTPHRLGGHLSGGTSAGCRCWVVAALVEGLFVPSKARDRRGKRDKVTRTAAGTGHPRDARSVSRVAALKS